MSDTTDPTCPPAHLQHAIAVFRRHAFAALLAGGTPSLADIAEIASREAVGVAHAIAWLEARGALERDGDRLVGAHGLTRRPTAHTLTIGDRTLHTWCAFDAIAIPVALATNARVTTTCPTCGRALAVDVGDGNVPDTTDLVLWLPGGECRNVIADFCAHANLFCAADHLATWRSAAANPPGRTLPLADVPTIAVVEWADVARDAPMSENTSADRPPATVCGCCGEERAESEVVRLGDRGDVALCDACVDWLRDQRAPRAGNRLRRAVPVLATADVGRALHHYETLGFETEGWQGGGYGFAFRDDIELHFGQVEGLDPKANGISWYLFVHDADALHAEWAAAHPGGQHIAATDTEYGLREGRYVDPDGNLIRYGSPLPG